MANRWIWRIRKWKGILSASVQKKMICVWGETPCCRYICRIDFRCFPPSDWRCVNSFGCDERIFNNERQPENASIRFQAALSVVIESESGRPGFFWLNPLRLARQNIRPRRRRKNSAKSPALRLGPIRASACARARRFRAAALRHTRTRAARPPNKRAA